MSDHNKPVAKVTIHPITASIWRNQGSNGQEYYNVTFERRYKDDAGKWQSASSFSFTELLIVAKVADRAYDEIYRLRAAERQVQQVEE